MANMVDKMPNANVTFLDSEEGRGLVAWSTCHRQGPATEVFEPSAMGKIDQLPGLADWSSWRPAGLFTGKFSTLAWHMILCARSWRESIWQWIDSWRRGWDSGGVENHPVPKGGQATMSKWTTTIHRNRIRQNCFNCWPRGSRCNGHWHSQGSSKLEASA